MNIYLAAASQFANSNGIIDSNSLPHTPANDQTIRTIFLIIFGIIGALVLLVVVLAGARYTFSKGEPENIQKAKNELKYALMGLMLVALAATIVGFVLGRL